MPPQRLALSQSHLDAIAAQIDAASGAEICGFLVGVEDTVRLVLPVANVSARPAVHFEMESVGLVRAFITLEEAGYGLLAIYHSHPRGAALYPSETDLANAHYPDAAYVIAGYDLDGRVGLRCFLLEEGTPREIPVKLMPSE